MVNWRSRVDDGSRRERGNATTGQGAAHAAGSFWQVAPNQRVRLLFWTRKATRHELVQL